MSSRFVSGGTNDEPSERDEEWRKAQQEVEARHQQKVEQGKQEGGKSLYETLQANKAAKQDKFEESIRLKNQFRALDEGEAEFLDGVLKEKREKEAAVKKDMSEQLNAFRRQQQETEKAAKQAPPVENSDATQEIWSVGPRKRKKARNDMKSDIKLRRVSTVGRDNSGGLQSGAQSQSTVMASSPDAQGKLPVNEKETSAESAKAASVPAGSLAKTKAPTASLGLVAYSSDDEE